MVPFFPIQIHYFFEIARLGEVSECFKMSFYPVPIVFQASGFWFLVSGFWFPVSGLSGYVES